MVDVREISDLKDYLSKYMDEHSVDGGVLEAGSVLDEALLHPQTYDPGRKAVNLLAVAADVVDGQKVTVGADVFEVEAVATDSTDDTDNDDFNSTDDPLTVVDAVLTYSHITFAVGKLIAIEGEILRVSVKDGNDVTFLRGQSGTTAAAHADGNDVFKGNGIAGGSTVAVGLAGTLTPADFIPALVADAEEHGAEPILFEELGTDGVLLEADEVGALTTACTETLAGAGNAFASATMFGGRAAGVRQMSVQTRVPTAVEITMGLMYFSFDFVPSVKQIAVNVTATPGVASGWDGSFSIDGNRVVLADDGAVNWDGTETVTLVVTD